MRDRALLLLMLLVPSAGAQAQVVRQPTPRPPVTAENTSWFRAGEPIKWNGELYYPDGVLRLFSHSQMVLAGSYKGIPLYTDIMLEPDRVILIPLPGERMHPYARRELPRPTDSTPAATARPTAVGTSGRTDFTALNASWITFDGRRWVSTGKAVDYDTEQLTQIGTYRGWSVYQSTGDRSTIYLPVSPGKLSPYRAR